MSVEDGLSVDKEKETREAFHEYSEQIRQSDSGVFAMKTFQLEKHRLQRATSAAQVASVKRNIRANGYVATYYMIGFVREGYELPDITKGMDITALQIVIEIVSGAHRLQACRELLEEEPEEFKDLVVTVQILNDSEFLFPTESRVDWEQNTRMTSVSSSFLF